MKTFLEEYGFAILSAIVVILLILMASPIGVTVRNSLDSTIEEFAEVTGTATDSMSEKLAQELQHMSDPVESQSEDRWYLGTWYTFGGSGIYTIKEDGTLDYGYTNVDDSGTIDYELSQDGTVISFFGENYVSDGKGHLVDEAWNNGANNATRVLTKFPNVRGCWSDNEDYGLTLEKSWYDRYFTFDQNEIIYYGDYPTYRYFVNDQGGIDLYYNGEKVSVLHPSSCGVE